MDPSTILALLTTTLASLSLVSASNDTTTEAPRGLTEPELLAAITVPSIVGGLLLISILAFIIIKVKEKRQTEGTYRPSSEEQAGSRTEPNAALKLPPEERLI